MGVDSLPHQLNTCDDVVFKRKLLKDLNNCKWGNTGIHQLCSNKYTDGLQPSLVRFNYVIVTLSKYWKILKEHNHNFFPQELLSASIQQNIPV